MPIKKHLPIVVLSIIVALLATVYGALAWTGTITDLMGDSSGYLLAARYYSPYHAAQAVIIGYKSQIIYPPLFPWLLALVNGGYNLLAAHLLVAAFALAGVITLFVWLRKESLPLWLSASAALVYAIMPATYIQMLNIWTEFPFIFFSLAAIVVVSQAESTSSNRLWWFAAALVVCATLIRVAALPLLVAFGMFLLLRRPRNYVWIGLLAALPFFLWLIYSSQTEVGVSSYVGHWKEKYALDPLGLFLNQLKTESLALLAAWRRGWFGDAQVVNLAAVIYGFGAISLVGWFGRLKALKFDALYVAVYLCMLLAWPHPEEALRYSLVLYPIFVAYGFMLLARFFPQQGEMRQKSWVIGGILALLVLSLLPTLVMNVRYFQEKVPDEIRGAKHTAEWYQSDRPKARRNSLFLARLIAHLKEVRPLVPENECVFAIKPAVVMLYLDRSSYAPPGISASDDLFLEKIQKCRFAYVMSVISPSYAESLYPFMRLGKRGRLLSVQRLYEGSESVVGALIEIVPQKPSD